jgi:transcriptional regulator of acetoin/glycerol metabolism
MAPASMFSDRLAKARERFLAAEPVDTGVVREPILASWVRSRHWHVAADHIELRYIEDPAPETSLARAADPVLRRLHEQLDGQPISIILTDAHGLVLTRLTADRELERHLEAVKLAPGFSYSEQLVGTNGIGTALEGGLRGGAAAPPDIGQDHRRDRPDLLAQACRSAAGLAGPGDRRPDFPGGSRHHQRT